MQQITSSEELAVRASLQLVVLDDNSTPVSFGSGFIVLYNGRHFLMSVAHVTDMGSPYKIAIELGLATDERGVPLKPIGGLYHFDAFSIGDPSLVKEVEDLFKNGERLDISFAELAVDFPLIQQELDFGAFKVEEGGKAILEIKNIVQPTKGKKYCFFGRIRHKPTGLVKGNLPEIKMENTLKYGLDYLSSNEKFHRFLSREVIYDSADYQGCSGAPILDENGCVVAIACAVRPNSKLVYGFPISWCLELVDQAMKIEALQRNEGSTRPSTS
ncbi:MAG TPA: hypothetical protein VL093_04405 [Flavipsychrobacter sp.]|nr:hypothetical protein [Flavipsychrobacter sp.]